MTTMTTPTIEIEKIDVAEGFNARTTMELESSSDSPPRSRPRG